MRLQDLDGWWLCAVAELETCRTWLKRGTRAYDDMLAHWQHHTSRALG
ncbi:MAG: hypothetical protein ACXW0F_12470 [Gaiellaceae bacterium]